MLQACGQPQDTLCGGHAKTQAHVLVRVGPYVATHLPGRRLEPVLLANGDELFAVQVAVPGDAEVLADLLQFLLYPVRGGQRDAGGGVQVIWVPEAQLPWKRGGNCSGFCPSTAHERPPEHPGVLQITEDSAASRAALLAHQTPWDHLPYLTLHRACL